MRGARTSAQWDVVGKCHGLTADPLNGKLIATVNEDANSSVYLIDPNGSAVQYQYNDGGIAHGGGTDAIEIYDGIVLISASAPGTSGTAGTTGDLSGRLPGDVRRRHARSRR